MPPSLLVMADGLFEFLRWAQERFRVYICSLGHEDYLFKVLREINRQLNSTPENRIQFYSARPELNVLEKLKARGDGIILPASLNKNPGLQGLAALRDANMLPPLQVPPEQGTPKDMKQVLPFLDATYPILLQNLGIVVDDTEDVWPQDQKRNLIKVQPDSESSDWDVKLKRDVQPILKAIHSAFFQEVASWNRIEKFIKMSKPQFTEEVQQLLSELPDPARIIAEAAGRNHA
jgi:hypothetical protein